MSKIKQLQLETTEDDMATVKSDFETFVEKNMGFTISPYQKDWIDAVTKAMAEGKTVVISKPYRHPGKSFINKAIGAYIQEGLKKK